MSALPPRPRLLSSLAAVGLTAIVTLTPVTSPAFPGAAFVSKFYVADAAGNPRVQTGAPARSLTPGSAHTAAGATIETSSGNASLVLSSGTALFLGAQTELHLHTFSQTPFPAKWTDLNAEPSTSHVVIEFTSGTAGISTNKLAPGSLLELRTPHGSVVVPGGKIMIEIEGSETRVLLIEGSVSVNTAVASAAAQTLRPGQQAVLRKPHDGADSLIFIQPVMDEQQARLDEIVSRASLARRTVFFQPIESVDGVLWLQAFQIAPDTPGGGFFLKPAEITH